MKKVLSIILILSLALLLLASCGENDNDLVEVDSAEPPMVESATPEPITAERIQGDWIRWFGNATPEGFFMTESGSSRISFNEDGTATYTHAWEDTVTYFEWSAGNNEITVKYGDNEWTGVFHPEPSRPNIIGIHWLDGTPDWMEISTDWGLFNPRG